MMEPSGPSKITQEQILQSIEQRDHDIKNQQHVTEEVDPAYRCNIVSYNNDVMGTGQPIGQVTFPSQIC